MSIAFPKNSSRLPDNLPLSHAFHPRIFSPPPQSPSSQRWVHSVACDADRFVTSQRPTFYCFRPRKTVCRKFRRLVNTINSTRVPTNHRCSGSPLSVPPARHLLLPRLASTPAACRATQRAHGKRLSCVLIFRSVDPGSSY